MKRGTSSPALAVSFGALAALLLSTPPAMGAPKDLPVEVGGEGPTGNDWTDYGGVSTATIWYRYNGNNYMQKHVLIFISPGNANFTANHAKASDGTKIEHIHYKGTYGSWGHPSVAEGNDFWDWFYASTPGITRLSNASAFGNCISHALNHYYHADTSVQAWVNPGKATALFDELTVIFTNGDNGDKDTITGDKCYGADVHIWTIESEDDEDNEPANSMSWKNNGSGWYRWTIPVPYASTNDAPVGRHPFTGQDMGFYETYTVYNKASR